jgi:hypothetical protein
VDPDSLPNRIRWLRGMAEGLSFEARALEAQLATLTEAADAAEAAELARLLHRQTETMAGQCTLLASSLDRLHRDAAGASDEQGGRSARWARDARRGLQDRQDQRDQQTEREGGRAESRSAGKET